MRYSQMSPQQRSLLLERPEYYPLHVVFLGKVGLLDYGAVALLRRKGVDFEVDDRQAQEILANESGLPVPIRQGERVPYEVAGLGLVPAAYPTNIPGAWERSFTALIALFGLMAFFISLAVAGLTALLAFIRKLRQPKKRKGLARMIPQRTSSKKK